MLRRNLQ